jgi:UDP-GlcNAc:undecaprenyl-phosphate GlcNAc-1-phosphate transferase
MSFSDALRALAGDAAVVWGLLLATALVLLLTPLVARLAPRIGGLDDSADRPRVHSAPVPRIGGLAIVAGILVPAALLVELDGTYTAILLAAFGVAALGLVDDLRGLRPSLKLAGVALLALVPVVGYELTIDHVTLPLVGDHDLGWVGYPLAVLWIAGVANLVNLIDGMDALAAGIVAIAAAAFAILAASFGRMEAAALAAIVCGATLGFLRHNYHPAKIFMGDSGALALGFLIAALALDGLFKTAAAITLVAPMLVLAVPILDTSFVVLKRLKYRRPPWGADHNHFYHRFLRIGLSQRRTAAYLHVWAALLAAYAIFARFFPPRPQGSWDLERALVLGAAGLAVMGASVWMVYSLEILKRRHLELLRLRRRPDPEEDEPEEAVERVLSAGPH